MKALAKLFFAAAALAAAACSSPYTDAPIRSMEIWPDQDGVHINAHGGGILYYDNTFYWFGEHKGERSNNALVGVTCYSSKDLVNWTNEGVALSVEEDPQSEITRGSIMERPKVIYNKATGKFVMWFHLELRGRGYNAARSGVAISDNVTGPYKYLGSTRGNPGIYPVNMTQQEIDEMNALDPADYPQSWTPEWVEAVKKGLLFKHDFQEGQMSRDQTLYVDDDGKAYHIYSAEDNLTLNIAELTDDYTAHSGRYARIIPAGHNEAPAIFKKDGVYWMITSGCTGWDPNAARMFSATDIFGPWTQHPNPCTGEDADLTYHGQSTFILPVPGKKDAFIFMADNWRPRNPIDGRYIWLPILFRQDGTPYLEFIPEWNIKDQWK